MAFLLAPENTVFTASFLLMLAIAVLEGYMGRKSPFIRTPKFNVIENSDKWEGNKYIIPKITFATLIEGLFCLYFIFGIVSGIRLGDFGLLFFHLMLAVGFGSVFFLSVKPIQST